MAGTRSPFGIRSACRSRNRVPAARRDRPTRLRAHRRPNLTHVIFCVQAVLSPLLANIYLHWFDKLFYRTDGPAKWTNAKLVRFADDFVVLARYQGQSLLGWIEEKIEQWLGLEINREKTRVVDLRETKASLDFLGYTFRWQRDRYGRKQRYLHVGPSKKALQRERDRINEMTDRRQDCTPITRLIAKLNRQTRGWAAYFSWGYPRDDFARSTGPLAIDWRTT